VFYVFLSSVFNVNLHYFKIVSLAFLFFSLLSFSSEITLIRKQFEWNTGIRRKKRGREKEIKNIGGGV